MSFQPANWITLFADASWCPKTRAFGWAFWVKYDSPAKTLTRTGGGIGIESATAAEIIALMYGIGFIEENIPFGGKNIVVQSDCTGALDHVRQGLFSLVKAGAIRAYTKHVKGHQKGVDNRSWVNELCDKLAKREMRDYRGKFLGGTYERENAD